MSAHIGITDDEIVVRDTTGSLVGRHGSQMSYWGLQYDSEAKSYRGSPQNLHATLQKLITYLERYRINFSLSDAVVTARKDIGEFAGQLQHAIRRGGEVKSGVLSGETIREFIEFLTTSLSRQLKEHQIKAALHLLAVENGANFSVPGSGKTSVVLAVYEWLRRKQVVDAIFVVGPPSSFGPWQTEFSAVLGRSPVCATLAGGNIDERQSKYSTARERGYELFITSFQTLQRDFETVKRLFSEQAYRVFLVVDEAHYIKQVGGAWAAAVLAITQLAVRRCVLTGTPFPHAYADAFNLFDVLWPHCTPLPDESRTRLQILAGDSKHEEAAALLQNKIGPLFYRVRKGDLKLSPQVFHPPMLIEMAPYEKLIHDSILDKITALSKEDFFRDLPLLTRLRRGRMIRLRQCVSYSKLLVNGLIEYSEDLLRENLSLADVVARYDTLEKPGKVVALLSLVASLRACGEKILIWSNFVGTLKLIVSELEKCGYGVRLIYGDTPVESENLQDELTRERIIREFLSPNSGIDILVANPAACAESISLHKSCSHAVYYDLSYNCAQYLQSLDRIHRVGGSETKKAHYYFLQYLNTIDLDILSNVQRKAENMGAIIDQDCPVYSLDMFSEDEELAAYERLFRK